MVYTEEYIKNKLAKELDAVHVVSIEPCTIFIHQTTTSTSPIEMIPARVLK